MGSKESEVGSSSGEPRPCAADVETHAEEVEQVRRHLVALRGGGTFLSAVDGRILVEWLEAGIPVALVATALERVAERRRKKRVKTPLALRSCRGEVRRLWERFRSEGLSGDPDGSCPQGLPRAHAAAEEPAPASLGGDGSESAPEPGGPEAVARQTERRLEVLFARCGQVPPASLADAAMAEVRRFHEQAWEAAGEAERSRLRVLAEEELASLRDSLAHHRWDRAVEEVARDLLRQRYPGLSATAVWDRLHGS